MQTIGCDIPGAVLWKTELMFRGVRYTPELAAAVSEGAAENYWPYTKRDAASHLLQIPVPYLFRLENGSVARVRVDDTSDLAVRRAQRGDGFALCDGDEPLCPIDFVQAHSWQSFRTSDGFSHYEAGVERLGDMLVVNVAPGCEYHRTKNDAGESLKCAFCAYGRFGSRSIVLGQVPGQVSPGAMALRRLEEVLGAAADAGEARHVYVTGGSLLGPEEEAERYLPVVAACRRAVSGRVTGPCGSGAVGKGHSRRLHEHCRRTRGPCEGRAGSCSDDFESHRLSGWNAVSDAEASKDLGEGGGNA